MNSSPLFQGLCPQKYTQSFPFFMSFEAKKMYLQASISPGFVFWQLIKIGCFSNENSRQQFADGVWVHSDTEREIVILVQLALN